MGSGQSWERTIFADGDQFTRKKFEDVESGVNDQGENQFAANKGSGGDADFVYISVMIRAWKSSDFANSITVRALARTHVFLIWKCRKARYFSRTNANMHSNSVQIQSCCASSFRTQPRRARHMGITSDSGYARRTAPHRRSSGRPARRDCPAAWSGRPPARRSPRHNRRPRPFP